MTNFSLSELKQLIQTRNEFCLSIYLPTHEKGAETQQNPIRFKNLLAEAAQKLAAAGMETEDLEDLLAPAQSRLEQRQFWQHQNQGLAMFLAPQQFHCYRLPRSFSPQVTVAHRFQVKPLIPLLINDGQYYILAASQNQTRLFQATRDHIHPMEVEEMPESLAEALRFDDPEKQLQFHSGNPSHSTPTYHGQGVGSTDNKVDILRFFQKVNDGLQALLNGSQAPLVFVGVDYLFPIYQEANHYPHLLEEAIATNPDTLIAQDLHQQTWGLVEPYFTQVKQAAIAKYQDQTPTPNTITDLRDILVAAHDGQIESLFFRPDQAVWGQFDAEARTVSVADHSSANNDDLLNLAVIYTLFCDGEVFAVETEELAAAKPAAALLRYPLPKEMATAS